MLKIKSDRSFHLIPGERDDGILVEADRDLTDEYLELEYTLDMEILGEEYVLFPACAYRGNQFASLRKHYPPEFTEDEASVDMEVTITDVPRLHKDGSGSIQVTTGDVSVPCVAVYSEKEKKVVFVYTIQQIDGKNLGLSYEQGRIGITYPHMRKERIYRWPFLKEGKDSGMDFAKGQRIHIPCKILETPCRDIKEFYRIFCKNRKCMGMDCERPEVLPVEEQIQIQIDKFNQLNWSEEAGFYGVTTLDHPETMWQLGWVGGGISSYALMKLGGELEWKRGIRTLKHVFRTQLECGLFVDECDRYGIERPDAGLNCSKKWHFMRRSGDILYFLMKHFALMQEKQEKIPESFLAGTRKLADTLLEIWVRYGQFGQFADRNTGELVVGGSTAGALIPGALAAASRFLGEERYLTVARESGEMFYQVYALKGYTVGGPGEILQCPDSESAFALLESYVALYEVTQEEVWLEHAVYLADFCSSWVVAYNYRFPEGSEFARLEMKTVGSVFANVQNKHSAPGICTLSGDSLYKLYRWTGESLYLELCRDIALTISQYMSTEKRPVYSWDVPKDASLLGDDSIRVPRMKLPQGYICERVNMSDWESQRCVGGVFNGSTWAEVSNLLALAETIPLLQKEEGNA